MNLKKILSWRGVTLIKSKDKLKNCNKNIVKPAWNYPNSLQL